MADNQAVPPSYTRRSPGWPGAPPVAYPASWVRPQSAYVEYAGFWRRVWAMLIDGVIVGLAFLVIGFTLDSAIAAAMGAYSASSVAPSLDWLHGVEVAVIRWLYFALMESSRKQATLGKLLIGIKVTDLEGRRISFWRATGRTFAKELSGLVLMIGYLMAGFTAKKQALHDILAGCLVVMR
ncbi:MAG TPA: RDD family protein [Armatimonadota bacterium]